MSESAQAAEPSAGPSAARAGLGLVALIAIVVGSMIGSGIFALPSQMAGSAAPGPLLIGWAITGVGMLMLLPAQRVKAWSEINPRSCMKASLV